jgi:hypothetical protein
MDAMNNLRMSISADTVTRAIHVETGLESPASVHNSTFSLDAEGSDPIEKSAADTP